MVCLSFIKFKYFSNPEEEEEEEGRERCEHAESAASCANIPTLHRSQNSRTKHAAVVVFSCRLSVSHNFLHLFSIHSFSYRIFPMRGAICLLAMPLGYDHYKRAATRPQPRLRLIVVIVRNVGGSRRSWVCHRTLTRHLPACLHEIYHHVLSMTLTVCSPRH